MLRQLAVGLFMGKIMGDMCEKSAPGTKLFHQAQRVGDSGMRGMRLVPQRIEKQYVQAAQALHGLRRYLTEVGKIGGRPKTEPVDLRVTVQYGDRFKARPEQLQGAVDAIDLHARDPAVLVIGVKDVFKDVLQRIGGSGKSVQRNFFRA